MSRVIDFRDDGDDRDWPNAASVPSLPITRKRLRDEKESSKDARPRSENGPKKKTALGSAAEVVADLEREDDVEVAPRRNKRRGITSEPTAKKEVEVAPRRNQRRGVRRSESIAKTYAAGKCAQILKGLHATDKHGGSEDAQAAAHRESHKGFAATASSWQDRLSELADYSEIHGHCNVPRTYSENTKLANWVRLGRPVERACRL
jgi:hypothetical protein